MNLDQAKAHFNTGATHHTTGHNKNQKIKYLDNVLMIGRKKVIDNRNRQIERECMVHFSAHLRKLRQGQRGLSAEQITKAVTFGIEIESVRNGKKRMSYFYDDIFVTGSWKNDRDYEVLTAYNIRRAYKQNFLNEIYKLEQELKAAGTSKFEAVIVDLTAATANMTAMILSGQTRDKSKIMDNTIVWRSGEELPKTEGRRLYSLTIKLNCIGGITLDELRVLEKWGLGTATSCSKTVYSNGEALVLNYNLSDFCGNVHDWSYC